MYVYTTATTHGRSTWVINMCQTILKLIGGVNIHIVIAQLDAARQ